MEEVGDENVEEMENTSDDDKEVETTGVSYGDDEGNKVVSDFVLALLSLCINHLNMFELQVILLGIIA